MDYKKLGLGLGVFSIALGALEVGAPRRVANFLGLDEEGTARKVIFGFGLRELMAGAMLLRGPAVSTNVWNRVIGDAMDAGALLLAFGPSRKKGAMTGAWPSSAARPLSTGTRRAASTRRPAGPSRWPGPTSNSSVRRVPGA
jgi:hypothetical protein